tara:strand:- start:5026 stop:5502 length:477 start_codon:yes stop_codon:yes gene_type:complete
MSNVSADGYSVTVTMNHDEYQKLGEMTTIDNEKWIYESPDKGETVYRRRLNAPHEERELYVQGKSKHYYDYSRNGNSKNPFIPKTEFEQTWEEMDQIEPLTPKSLGVQNSWIVDVNTDYSVSLPKELLRRVAWKEGDTLKWVSNPDGSFSLTKVDNVS